MGWTGVAQPRARRLTALIGTMLMSAGSLAVGAAADASINSGAGTALPSAVITSPAPGAVMKFGQSFQMEVDATAAEGGAPIAEVRFWKAGVLRFTDTEPPYAFATSGTIGPLVLGAVAVDAAGNESPMSSVEVLFNPGPGVFLPTLWGPPVLPVDDVDETLSWTAIVSEDVNAGAPADDPRTWLDQVEVLVDGVVTQTLRPVDCAPDCSPSVHPTEMSGQVRWNPASLGVGEHSITIRATDSAGFVRVSPRRYSVIERPTLTVRSSSGSPLRDPIRVPAGSLLVLRADAAASRPTASTQENVVTSVSLWVDGRAHNQDDGCADCGSVTVKRSWAAPDEPGVHDLTVVARDRYGLQTSVTRRLELYPGTRILPGRGFDNTYGRTATVSGRLLWIDTDRPLAGRRVTVQWRPAGASLWRTLATPTTSSTGWVAVRHTPGRNGRYRLAYAGVPSTIGPSSAYGWATVHPRLTGRFRNAPEGVKRGQRSYVDVRTWPVEAGAVWHLQRLDESRDRFYTVATRRIPTTGRSSFPVVLNRRGFHHFRIYRPLTARYGEAEHYFTQHVY